MDSEKQGDIWTWIVIGMVFGAVTPRAMVLLFGNLHMAEFARGLQ